MPFKIPFNKPALLGSEQNTIAEAIASGQVSGDGSFSKLWHELLEEALGVPKALLTTSCTDALEMSALLLKIKPGDEVIVPSFTFVSTVNAFVLRGAHPVFADIRPDTLNIDESKIEPLITKRTKAIVPVHYAGVGCEMDHLCSLAKAYDLTIVEDNAHGLSASTRTAISAHLVPWLHRVFTRLRTFGVEKAGLCSSTIHR
jgi:dTDP-4-amino-4,6-dideoxygalactose transaminase